MIKLAILVMLVLCTTNTDASPNFGFWVNNAQGVSESYVQFSIDTSDRIPFFWSNFSQGKSAAAFDWSGGMYSGLGLPAPPQLSSVTTAGRIWSGTGNTQDYMVIQWHASNDIANYGWRFIVESQGGSILADIVPNFTKNGFKSTWDSGSFRLPILPCSDWQDGYSLSLVATNAVPEPCSLMALVGLLTPLGVGLIRKKTK